MILATACSGNDDQDCSLVLCAPDQVLTLELIADGANILAGGAYDPEDISVIPADGAPPELDIRESSLGGPEAFLELYSPEWEPGSYGYTIEIGNEWAFGVEANLTPSTDPCCRQSLIIESLTSDDAVVEAYAGYFTLILR